MAEIKTEKIRLGTGDLQTSPYADIASGIAVPNNASGNDGDIYVRIAGVNSELYIKKNSLWYPVINSSGGNRVLALYDAVIGSALQVANGSATHTTFASAIPATPVGGKILVLNGTYTENVSLVNQYKIDGQGHATTLSGTLALEVGSNYSTIQNIRFNGNITINSSGSFVRECFLSSTSSVTDNGVANSVLIIKE